jgi:hypothetical protein
MPKMSLEIWTLDMSADDRDELERLILGVPGVTSVKRSDEEELRGKGYAFYKNPGYKEGWCSYCNRAK